MTSPIGIGVLLALSAIALATLAGWVVAAVAGWSLRSIERIPAPSRAALIAQARLAPLVLAALCLPIQIVAFVRFEGSGPESAGPALLATASAGLLLIIDALGAGCRSWTSTRVVTADWRDSASALVLPQWTRAAWRISPRFPVVAVVGVVRPQLFVASQVADACTPHELAAIAAHEAAHVRAHDNLIRWCFRITPGARVAMWIAQPLELAWTAAAEEAADLEARQATSGLDLASALTKVARLAAGAVPEPVPASALIGGSDLQARVRRLFEPPASSPRRVVAWLPVAVVLAVALVIQGSPALHSVHELFEMLVRHP